MFTQDLIGTSIEFKMEEEFLQVRNRPYPCKAGSPRAELGLHHRGYGSTVSHFSKAVELESLEAALCLKIELMSKGELKDSRTAGHNLRSWVKLAPGTELA